MIIDKTEVKYDKINPVNSISIIKFDKGPENERREFTKEEKENISKFGKFLDEVMDKLGFPKKRL